MARLGPAGLLGVVLTATGFVVEFRAPRLSRLLRQNGTALDDRLDAIAREKAMRLNAYLRTWSAAQAPPMKAAAHPVRAAVVAGLCRGCRVRLRDSRCRAC